MYHRFKWTRRSVARNELTRQYEPLQPHLLMALASHYACEVFLDVGANVGAYALLMSEVASISDIHAFEPSPETFAELSANVALNGARVRVHNQAASDRAGMLQFGIVNTLSGANSVVDTSIHDRFAKRIEVPCVRIDDVIDHDGRRVCIKIDVEGHELATLAGMDRYLSRNQGVIQVEDYGRAGELDAVLEPYGFSSLFRVGADRYFANLHPKLSDRERVAVFEASARRLVETNLAALEGSYSRGVSPVTVPLGNSIKLQLGGRLASLARAVYHKFRR